MYPTSLVDGDGKAYDGANKYVPHFPKGLTPPAKGFWSLTMYDGDYFFVANPLNRYTLSPRNALKYNEDGSLELFIQDASPGKEKESNWRPYFGLYPSFLACAKSSSALAFSPFFSYATPRFWYAWASFGSSRIASVQSAIALSKLPLNP